jgi:hypothetical protein
VAGQPDGRTGASVSYLDKPFGISVTSSNDLYIGDTNNHRIIVIHRDSSKSPFVIGSEPDFGPNKLNSPSDLFTTDTALYVTDTNNNRVQKLSLTDPLLTLETYLNGFGRPYCIFVDNHNNTYLGDLDRHQVFLFPVNINSSRTVAGVEYSGVNLNQLCRPHGVFVNDIGTMYIADPENHRIIKWLSNASSGTIVAGNGTSGSSSMQLNLPTQVLVDTNEYMYISELGNSCITRWAPDSTYGVCIASCTGAAGTTSTHLNKPHSLAFDSNGSLYVSDRENHRVQKFEILQNSGKYSIPF